MISRIPFAYSSMIRRGSCERESLAFGTLLPGSGRSVVPRRAGFVGCPKDTAPALEVAGKTCQATMTNTGFTEFESWSTYQGVRAWYRDWQMTSSACTIR